MATTSTGVVFRGLVVGVERGFREGFLGMEMGLGSVDALV